MAKNKRKIKLIRGALGLSFSLIILSLICFYAWQTFDLMAQKYQTHNLASEINKLKTENQQLKIEVAKLQSIKRVQDFALNLEMSPVPSIVYLPVNLNEVVLKK